MSRTPAARPLLTPLVPLYRLAVGWRELRLARGWEQVRRLERPVVSIGNLTAGGAGKTPFAIALAQALTRRGVAVDLLSRGYGRTSKLAARVNVEGTAEEFGDEPLLIARAAGVPVYVASRRFESGRLAEAGLESARLQTCKSEGEEEAGASQAAGKRLRLAFSVRKVQQGLKPFSSSGTGCGPAEAVPCYKAPDSEGNSSLALHLLDDGFQHRQLHRDIDIVLLSRADLGDRLLPAGNLREPLSALQRATVIAIPADEPEMEEHLNELLTIDRNSESQRWQGPVWRVRRQMQVPAVEGPVVAFCGIARPAQFFAGLEAAGVHLASRIAFADHQLYREHELDCIQDAARSSGATAILTTEKDLVRMGALAGTLSASIPLLAVPLRTEIEDEDAAIDWLLQRLQ